MMTIRHNKRDLLVFLRESEAFTTKLIRLGCEMVGKEGVRSEGERRGERLVRQKKEDANN